MPGVLMCVGCQRAPGLPGWGLLELVQRGRRAPSQVELFWGWRSLQSHAGVGICSCLMPLKAPLLPGAMVKGPTSFSPKDRATWG